MKKVNRVYSSKKEALLSEAKTNIHEAHLHAGVFYEVIKIYPYGKNHPPLILCEKCIIKMWNKKWIMPETKAILEKIMHQLKIYDQ